jgi:calcineurin-like phosphoesterase family protein
MLWFTADLHFGHKNIITYETARSIYKTVEEMDEAIVNNWNNLVHPNDTVYLLGDVSMCGTPRTLELLTALQGHIHLIKGNHDSRMKGSCKSRFESIHDYMELKINKQLIVLCHYPFATWRNSHHGSWHLHGHSHGSSPRIGKRLDVGVDPQHMAPITIDEVRYILGEREIVLTDYHGKGGGYNE